MPWNIETYQEGGIESPTDKTTTETTTTETTTTNSTTTETIPTFTTPAEVEFVKAVRETEGKIQLWHDVYGGDLIKYGGKKLVSRSWSSNSNVRRRQGPWHHYRRFIDFFWKTSMCFRFHICIALMIVVLDVKTGFIQASWWRDGVEASRQRQLQARPFTLHLRTKRTSLIKLYWPLASLWMWSRILWFRRC